MRPYIRTIIVHLPRRAIALKPPVEAPAVCGGLVIPVQLLVRILPLHLIHGYGRIVPVYSTRVSAG